ncbi:HAMP domain-containing histidine kinase [Kribbella antibiotica]|uniref:histidine kinase n=1 Tax=Kribbella antibiotica TaxID=190195 RepID=A0A4R4ZZ31_9ACTN|nr:HAMP domain-containing sensor histidine kinase [Kribbella antibiotica]TDD63419.1 HAMP domain-containing histidine kinase [Kribbella antibiotica]
MKLRLVASYVALVAVALALFTIPVALSSSAILHSTLEQTAQREAQLFAPLVVRDDAAAAQAVTDRTRDFESATGSRVRLITSTAGIEDTQVLAALRGANPAPVWGRHPLLQAEAVSVVLPVREAGRTTAVVQIVSPAAEVNVQIAQIWRFRLFVGAAVLLTASAVAVVIATTLARPLHRLDAVARRIGDGDYSARASTKGPPEITRLARTLNDSARQTDALLSSQRSFVADASHQLRTPLAAMQLTLDNVRDTTDDPALSRRLETVDAEIHRMSRMVEGLLALARAESTTASPRPIDLSALVDLRVSTWSVALAERNVALVLDIERPCWITATPGALEQILDNVLSNALAVSPAGSRVTVHVRRTGPAVELVISDQGPGMTAAQRARAFDRFWRAGPPGTGTGLGLSIVKQLIEHDGGHADLAPAPGGGLAVHLNLRAVS